MEQELRFEKGAKDMASGLRAVAAPEVAFSRHRGICRSDVSITYCKLGPASRFPAGSGPGHQARRKETRLLIVATSSGRLFLDRVGRHQSPSPLHRHSHTNTHFSQAPAKGDISTLPAGGHFYFALTRGRRTLWQQSDNVPFEQSRNVPLTAPSFGDAGRTTTHDPGR
jgi:hypothetical protein